MMMLISRLIDYPRTVIGISFKHLDYDFYICIYILFIYLLLLLFFFFIILSCA